MNDALLFLDFDGVLHPLRRTEIFTCTQPLISYLGRYPDVGVVITSDWRRNHVIDDLRQMLPPAIANRVIGATPDLSAEVVVGLRHAEIQRWRKSHGHCGPWIAIDDSPQSFPAACDNLYLVPGSVGLEARDMHAIASLMMLQAG